MRIALALALAVSLPRPTFALLLEGEARFRAVAECFTARGPVLLEAEPPKVPKLYYLRKQVAKETLTLSFDYDMVTGRCTFDLFQPRKGLPGEKNHAFQGRCHEFPYGSPFPLALVQDPRSRTDLLPVMINDLFGFGSVNGYLVFPPGALSIGFYDGSAPLGFSGRFLYTTTYVPPSAAVDQSRWQFWDKFGSRGVSHERCIHTGTLRLGDVPIY